MYTIKAGGKIKTQFRNHPWYHDIMRDYVSYKHTINVSYFIMGSHNDYDIYIFLFIRYLCEDECRVLKSEYKFYNSDGALIKIYVLLIILLM